MSSVKRNVFLTSASPGQEVVITGMAGRFPDSDDIYEFRENLYNKIDLVTDDTRRWELTHPEIPQRTGKINFVNKFDAGFFGVHHRQAHTMDPMCRMLIERSYEAIVDAGINPKELEGSATGVFVGACFSETEKSSFYEKLEPQNYGITGCSRSMLAQRISYYFQFVGPSYVSDTACSSSLFAFEHAYKAIREGKCDTAIVGGCNLCLHPVVSLQFARLGVLSPDGACKSFDNSANGYARSEAVAAIVLQKAKDSRRIYAEVIHSKTNCDGFKEQGITYPSGKVQKVLLDEFYDECGVAPSSLTFVEAHGTGTKVGDPEELGTLDEVFCSGRNRPLHIGSVKSNIGHNEPVSGLCSIVKVVIGMENGFLPPNMHYKVPREGVEALVKGRMKVVNEKTPVPDNRGLFGINSFGFGGANSHLLLRWNPKVKEHSRVDSMPRLVCLSGRNETFLENMFEFLGARGCDTEYIALLHEIFKFEIPGNYSRGFAIIGKNQFWTSIGDISEEFPLHLNVFFSGIDAKWAKCIQTLQATPIFAAHLQRLENIVITKKLPLNISDLVNNFNEDDTVHSTIATVIAQTGLIDLLKLLQLSVDCIDGVNLGELAAAYARDQLDLEQTLLATYYISIANPNSAGVFVLEHFRSIMPQKLALHLSKTLFTSKPKLLDSQNANFLIIGHIENLPKSCTKLIGNSFDDLLTSLGRLYQLGYNFNLANLYPPVRFPVSRGTPMISPMIRWDHSKDWFVTVYKAEDKMKSGHRVVEISLRDDEWSFVKGHVIDGRHLFPATGYLSLAWETLGMMTGKLLSDMSVVFEDVKFTRACTLSNKVKLDLNIVIQRGGGNFEIVEGGSCVVSGRIYEVKDTDEYFYKLPIPSQEQAGKKLSEKDVYKELRLRGYNYKDEFKAVREYDLENNCGKISWTGNWISFMDNLLQLQILQEDTRNLYVPTRIDRLVVDPKKHITSAKNNNMLVPAYVYKDINVLKSGAIEVKGLYANSIARKKQADPVLEIYKFIPNNHHFSLEVSVRILVQLALENHNVIKVKTVELQSGSDTIISPLILEALADLPLIQPEIFVHLDEPMEVSDSITVDDRKFGAETNCHFAIATGILRNIQLRRSILNVIKPGGFVISREQQRQMHPCEDLNVLAVHVTPCEVLVLAQKRNPLGPQSVICVDSSFNWLTELQKTESEVLLYSQDAALSGILGLVNCLRREPNGERIKCVFILDSAPPFDVTNGFYKEQLCKGMAINVYKNGQWGTYRHLLLEDSLEVLSEHCFVNVTTRGDLSSLRWIQAGLTSQSVMEPEKTLVHIYCTAINFRDVMTASGRIQNDVVTRNRLQQECVQGFEFAGRDANGRRVMGMVVSNAMATMVSADSHLLWTIPEHWTMEEAVTVPAVYGTVIYGLLMRAKLRYGQSILIHSGTGGVGQAAINICLHYGCKVFVTVGTEEKRDFIRRNFPRIKASYVGSSRDCSFEQMVFKQTNGRGVDLVLNSLADDKLQASVRCLAVGGKFLEIGKFDLANDSPLSLKLAEKKCTFHGIMLDLLFSSAPRIKDILAGLLLDGIKSGAIKPLPRTCFSREEIEQAFRFMASGKHIGKVLIRVRPEEAQAVKVPEVQMFSGIPRVNCDSDSSYVVIGGLGGFGLELIDWLILRGARKLIISSRRGVTTGYQSFRIKIWKSYGTMVEVSTKNVQNYDDVVSLLKQAEAIGPVKAIFNLAVDLRDGILENQTVSSFSQSAGPKAIATQHLDTASRHICPTLENFVVFSSVSCGRGNAGQTNYGWSNSVMERICEKRKASNLPALAIQWGAIGDVGLVADMQEEHQDLVIGGTLQQRISGCLQVLDKFLRQDETIVASMVVAEKRSNASGADNIVDAVVSILGLRDLKTVSLHSSFPELGMDSMMAVEIKQTLEREYEVFLTPQDIRCMTFSRLQEIATEKTTETRETVEDLPKGVKLLLRFIANEEESKVESVVIPSLSSGPKTAFLIPGIEGMASVFFPLAKNLKARAFCIQFPYEQALDSIPDMAQHILPVIEEQVSSHEKFTLVAYSFGCGVALQLVHLLESAGRRGTLILVDAAPAFMRQLIENQLEIGTEAEFQTSLLCALMSVYIPFEIIAKYKVALLKCANFEERIQFALGIAPKNMPHTPNYIKIVCLAAYNRAKAIYKYVPKFNSLQSEVVLYRPLNSSVLDIEEDYELSKIVGKPVKVRFFEGDHVSILENIGVVEEINRVMEGGDAGKGMEEVPLVVKQTIS